jgi:Carboxypeptidase regulatory-like domain
MRLSAPLKTAVCLSALAFAIGAVASARVPYQNPDQNQTPDQNKSPDQDQDPTGGIRGTISNSSGDRVAGARITVNGDPGPSASATTDDVGDFIVPKLPEGNYHVIISAKGYKDFQQDGIEVTADVVAVDAILEPDKDSK